MVVLLAEGMAGEEGVPGKKRGGGPRSPQGRRAASLNATKHGCRARVVLPAEIAARAALYLAALVKELAPANELELWLVEQIARPMAQIDRCWELMLAETQRAVNVAEFDWVDHRKGQVEELASRLARQPARVAHALLQTAPGAEWMIDRWRGIDAVLETTGTCEESLHSLIFDLMGVPEVLRAGNYKVPVATDIPALRALAQRELERLQLLHDEELVDREDFERTLAAAGLSWREDPEVAKLRRYEAMCRRELKWARAELDRQRSATAAAGDAAPPSEEELDRLLLGLPKHGYGYHVERVANSEMQHFRQAPVVLPPFPLPRSLNDEVEVAEATETAEPVESPGEAAFVSPSSSADTMALLSPPPIVAPRAVRADVPAPRPTPLLKAALATASRAFAPRNRRERRAAEARARKSSA